MLMIVSVISGSGFGGIQMVNRLLGDAIRQARIPGTIVSLHDPLDADWKEVWPDGICARGSKLRFLCGALLRRRHARRSVVLVSHVSLAPVGRLIKQVSGAQLYVFLHGVECWNPLSASARWGMRACDLAICNSQITLEKFRQANESLNAIRSEVVYLPARKLADSNGDHNHPPSSKTALRALIVGRLWGRGMVKGQRQLIEVWPDVIKDFPNAQLCIVGAGEGRREFEELAREQGVRDAITFAGEVTDEELDALYASSDVYAMPSRGEGFGLVFAEAMSRSLPCIASRFDAGSEVVIDGITGLHVDPDDRQELLKALKTLFGDPSLRLRMGEAGRRRAEEMFSIGAFNKKIRRILEGVCDV
ncbi:MAG: glycosyltransferase family 4 protein [Acidobacteriota bacterium]